MQRSSRVVGSLLGLVLIGCAGNPNAKLIEASQLAAERLGQQPAWTEPWDRQPPDWSESTVLDRDEAVALALRNNRMLRAELEMIRQADADLLQAGLMQNPVISFMVMFPDGGGRSMLRGSGIPIQPLQDLWLIPARQEVARAALQQTVLRVADRAVQTAAQVKMVYAKAQYARRAAALIRENMQLAEQAAGLIQARQAAGPGTQVAYNLARIRGQRLRSELRTMESEYKAMQRELMMLVGFAGAVDTWSVAPVHELNDELAAPQAEEALVALGYEQRLDLKAAEWTLAAADRQITLMQREGWPDLAVGFTFERSGAPSGKSGTKLPARIGNAAAQAITNRIYGVAPMPQAPMVAPWQPKLREMKWTLGPMFELELPIFDHNQAQVAKATHEHNQRVAEYEAKVQEVTREIRTALLTQHNAYEQVQFYRQEIMPDVGRNAELAQQTFVAGQENLTVYLEAQEDLIMTRMKILEFLRDYYVSSVELERAAGGRSGAGTPAAQFTGSIGP